MMCNSDITIRQYKRRKEKDKQENRCPTPPSSPQHDAPRSTRPERPKRPERPERPAGPERDDLVWVHVHTRHPSHPRFTDLYDKVLGHRQDWTSLIYLL